MINSVHRIVRMNILYITSSNSAHSIHQYQINAKITDNLEENIKYRIIHF